MMIALPKQYDKSSRSLPKGVYEGKAGGYDWKTWGIKGVMEEQKYNRPSVPQCEYERHVEIYGHHWEGMPEDLSKLFGFTYIMEHRKTGRKYLGSKQFLFWDGPVGGYKCTDPSDDWFDRTLWKESDWKDYHSSSKVVAKLVGEEPWNFRYLVTETCENKLQLHLSEVMQQVGNKVLTSVDADGNYSWLNENILGVDYRPPVPREKLAKVIASTAKAVRDYYLRPKVCERCGTVIPYGDTRCSNAPMFGKGECNDTNGDV